MGGSNQVSADRFPASLRYVAGLVAALGVLSPHAAGAAADRPVDFARDVQPIFTAHCIGCHGPKMQKGGLRLDEKAAALRGGDSGAVIVAKQSGKSLLLQLVTGTFADDPDAVMPPKGERLSAKQIAVLRAWIDQGAVWPDGTNEPTKLTTDHWSFQPLARPAPPVVQQTDWVRNPIDQFVLAKLGAAGLSPTNEAERRALIRRVCFDLIGLPPTPAETDAFINDPDPQAYEKLIDRLLASPHYGERWARHWLDVARYTESQGFERDRIRPNAWHYRDYIIRAFNDDKPYDRFMMEQVAGDAMEPVTSEGIIATSLLVCGSYDEVGANQQSAAGKAAVREEELEDLVSVVSQTFLGVTVNCARCHAHKFDPVPQADYYRMKSVFEGVRHGERSIVPPVPPGQKPARQRTVDALNEQINELTSQRAAIEEAARRRVLARQSKDDPDKPLGPAPIAQWTFDDGTAADAIGAMHGELIGGAAIKDGELHLNGKDALLRTAPLAKDVAEKTLEAWLTLPTLDQGGGGAVTLESANGVVFDSIVFAERQQRKWIAGSTSFTRTRDLDAPQETAAADEPIHMAITYAADGTITLYRNGELYAKPYKPNAELPTYRAGDGRVLMGMRHTGGGRPWLSAVIDQASLYDRALSRDEIAASLRSQGSHVSRNAMLAAMTAPEREQRDELAKQIDTLRAKLAALPPLEGVSYAGVRAEPSPTARLIRGDLTKPAEIVAPGALSVIAITDEHFTLPPDAPEAKRRLALANWLADPRNPLPARVMVNRVWHHHFGRGIVATPNDLGAAGAPPTHPQLLDWLASRFIADRWSIKKLHKLILTSATYRQSAAFNDRAALVDSQNTLLWRFEPRRLEGEVVRDAMLAVSGKLNPQMYGRSFQPFDIYENNAHFYILKDEDKPEFHRRTIYRMNVNSGKDPMLETLDCPDPSVKTPRRRETVTPLSALAMANNPFVVRLSKAFAQRVLGEAGGDRDAAARLASRYALGRSLTDEEFAKVSEYRTEHDLADVCWVLLNATEFSYVR